MNDQDTNSWGMPLQFGAVDKLLGEIQGQLAELEAMQDLPKTIDATELALMSAILTINELAGELAEARVRHETLRIHWVTLRKAQLEAVLAPPAPTTEKAEVSGEGPIPTQPDAENKVVDDKSAQQEGK